MENRMPTFAVFKDNRKVDSLVHCFIKELAIQKDDYLNLKGIAVKGIHYTLVWDDSMFPDLCELKGKDTMQAVISFQKHTYGCFAIIKKARG